MLSHLQVCFDTVSGECAYTVPQARPPERGVCKRGRGGGAGVNGDERASTTRAVVLWVGRGACFQPPRVFRMISSPRIPIIGFFVLAACAAGAEPDKGARVSTLEVTELRDFDKNPEPVRELIRAALALTRMNLTYTFASHDPGRGGMDCSGTIYHLLHSRGVTEAPRQSDQMCQWVMDKGAYQRAEKAESLEDAVFAKLAPGDLLFWSGTYESTKRALPVTHVMLFLGHRKGDGKPVIFGASDGRSYEGQKRRGVSVFDFRLPKPGGAAALHGFGAVPGLVREEIRKPLLPWLPPFLKR